MPASPRTPSFFNLLNKSLFISFLFIAAAPPNIILAVLDGQNGGQTIFAEYKNPIEMLKSVIGAEAPPDFDFGPFDRFLKRVCSRNGKLIWASDGRHEAFEMITDWQTTRNALVEGTISASSLWKEMDDFQKGLWKPLNRPREKILDDAGQERLRSPGYLK